MLRERQRLQERAGYTRPLRAAALTLAGIGTAALGASALNPFITVAGLCIAFAGVPDAVRGLVDARTAEEELEHLIEQIDELSATLERLSSEE